MKRKMILLSFLILTSFLVVGKSVSKEVPVCNELSYIYSLLDLEKNIDEIPICSVSADISQKEGLYLSSNSEINQFVDERREGNL